MTTMPPTIESVLVAHQTYADWAPKSSLYVDICSCGWRGAPTPEQALGDRAAAHQADELRKAGVVAAAEDAAYDMGRTSMRRQIADAWDEGYGRGRDDEAEGLHSIPNPYRTEETP